MFDTDRDGKSRKKMLTMPDPRLHSVAARQKMSKYLIGRTEGKWQNFVPPIQGGIFLTAQQKSTAKLLANADLQAPDSSDESEPPSPTFDIPDYSMRRRLGPALTLTLSSSASSVTSVSDLGREDDKLPLHADLGWHQTQRELDADLAKYPSLSPTVQHDIECKYRLMEQRVAQEGLYDCNYIEYVIEVTRYVLLLGTCILFLHWGWYVTSAIFLGLFWHQLVFAAHDAGHIAITHNYTIDTAIGIFIATWIGGLSLGWWKRSHNVHHIVTNSPEHDPDIELMPFFAISHRFFDSLKSTYYDKIMPYDAFARFIVPYQHLLYYPVLMLGRFNLYVLSWDYLLMGRGPKQGIAWWHRWFEAAGQVFFWSWFGYLMLYRGCPMWWTRVVFVLVSHVMTTPLHVQITLSHYAMSTSDLGQAESFAQKMLRTTMDVDCPVWMDWIHGGLQFQAVHHLFPRVPRHNLRRAQKLVKAFCEETQIPYALYGFAVGNKEVLSKLKDVGRQASVLAECQRVTAAKGFAGVFEH